MQYWDQYRNASYSRLWRTRNFWTPWIRIRSGSLIWRYRLFCTERNGKQIPIGGMYLNTDHEKTSVMAYRTLFEASGFHHANLGLHITHDMYVTGYFMLLFDLTPDWGASDGLTSHPDSGNIRIELKFKKTLTVPITCLLYLEYDDCVRIDSSRIVTTDFS